ncbi:cytochrome c oxidase accessory protein CcoG, partial [Phenylobacterium sp.]
DRNARMKLDASPWSFDKAWRKFGKHAAWIAVAFGTGGAWIFYFHDAPTLIRDFWVGQAPVSAYLSCAILTFTTYALAGTMREQVCTYMCPWPRIQGAMLDEHSLQVTYRFDRGEPRGPHKKGATWEGRGDCVDCHACVVVCPMGIDIRNGPQLECINCGLCIDACDDIMGKVGRPKGLIAYDTDSAVAARSRSEKPVYKLVRSRTIYYAVALVLVAAVMAWGFSVRTPLDMHVLRDRNPTFVRLHDGAIRNGYTLKIANRTFEPMTARISFSGVAGVTLKTPGEDATPGPISVTVEPNQVRAVRVLVTAPASALPSENMPAAFRIEAGDRVSDVSTTFLSGAANAR